MATLDDFRSLADRIAALSALQIRTAEHFEDFLKSAGSSSRVDASKSKRDPAGGSAPTPQASQSADENGNK